MANTYKIITDSCANLTDEMIDRFDIGVIPLVFIADGKECSAYTKGQPTELQKYYEMMRNKVSITTSCISTTACREMFEPVLQAGLDILYIGFTSALSATYSVAEQVLKELKAKYPERTVLSVDTLSGAMGQGLLVYYAAQMQAEGGSITSVCNWLEENKLKMCHYFTVDSLAHLYRSGRIKKLTYFIASTLNIKPVLHVDDDGRIIPYGNVMGRRASLLALVKKLQERIVNPEKQIISISHGDCPEEVEFVINAIRERIKVKDIIVNHIDMVLGAHVGPGGVGIFFLAQNR